MLCAGHQPGPLAHSISFNSSPTWGCGDAVFAEDPAVAGASAGRLTSRPWALAGQWNSDSLDIKEQPPVCFGGSRPQAPNQPGHSETSCPLWAETPTILGLHGPPTQGRFCPTAHSQTPAHTSQLFISYVHGKSQAETPPCGLSFCPLDPWLAKYVVWPATPASPVSLLEIRAVGSAPDLQAQSSRVGWPPGL